MTAVDRSRFKSCLPALNLKSIKMNQVINTTKGFIVYDKELQKARYIADDGSSWDLIGEVLNKIIKEEQMEAEIVNGNEKVTVMPSGPTPTMLAQARAALDVQANPAFGNIMQQVATASGQVRGLVVQDQGMYEGAGNMLIFLKGTAKSLAQMKKDALAFPKLYEKAVREAMRPVETMLNEAVAIVEKTVLAWAVKLEEAEKAHDAAVEAAKPAVTVTTPDVLLLGEVNITGGVVAALQQPSDVEAPPPAKIAGVGGGSVSTRHTKKVTVTDINLLLKAVVSKAKNREYITSECVLPNMKEVERLVLTEKKKIPGVEIVEEVGLTTRSN